MRLTEFRSCEIRGVSGSCLCPGGVPVLQTPFMVKGCPHPRTFWSWPISYFGHSRRITRLSDGSSLSLSLLHFPWNPGHGVAGSRHPFNPASHPTIAHDAGGLWGRACRKAREGLLLHLLPPLLINCDFLVAHQLSPLAGTRSASTSRPSSSDS